MAIKVRIVDPPTIQLKSSAGTVKQVDSGNGLTGGPITSTGTISVNANTGLIANSSGLFLANSVLFPNTINGNTAQDLRDYSDSVSGIAYSNAISVANTLASSAYSNAISVANDYASSAYSNAISVANTLASSAYSNAILVANDYASSAYSNAVIVANTLASSAYSNAILVANTLASSAYSNAIIVANNLASNAYSNAVTVANGYASSAYSNAIIVANNLASNAYSNAVTIANNLASSAYSNAVTIANNLASSAYSNAVTVANGYASSAYSNAVTVANGYASSAYSNAVTIANNLASNAYSNSIVIANNLASNAYSNAITFASNASNINTGTLSSSLLPISGVIANVYGSATEVPILTIDATGRVTNVSLANADAIDSFTYSSNTNTLSLLTSDGTTFNVAINSVNNFVVTGNLTVNGTQTYIQSNSVLFDDNILVLNKAINNDPSDIGIVGHYIDSQTLSWGSESISWGSNTAAWGAQNSYSGVFRDATDGIWKIFQSYTPDPDSSFEIDTANSSFTLAPLQISTLYANSISANGSVGTNGQVLHSDGTNIYWATDDVNYPAGSNTEIQFNDSGNFGANSGLTFDSGLGRLNVGNVGITSQTVFFGNSGLSFSNGSSNAVFVSANGNVGIGTTSPAGPLHVEASSGVLTATQGLIGLFKTTADYYTTFQVQNSQSAWQFSVRPSGDPNPGGVDFYRSANGINWTTAMSLTSSMRVGFGTTSPAEKLDVAGNIVTKNSTTPTSIGVYGTFTDSLNYERLRLSSNSTAAYIQTENVGTGTARPLRLGANNSTAVTIATSGDVGIGTSTPSVKLHVAGDALFDQDTSLLRIKSSTGASNYMYFGNLYGQNTIRGDSTLVLKAGGDITVASLTAYVFQFHKPISVNSTNIITTDPGGSTNLLNIGGGVAFSSSSAITALKMTPSFSPTAGTGKLIAFDIAPTINQTGSATGDYTALQIRPTITAATGTNKFLIHAGTVSSPDKFVLTEAGNVGIGTTTPAEKLDVAGNIQSSNTVFAVHFDNVSDISLKENISPLNNTIDTLNKLNPVSFDWKNSKTKSYGLIAQEVEQILPTIVHSKPDGTKTVNYIEIIAFLIAAVKDLQRQIDDINSK